MEYTPIQNEIWDLLIMVDGSEVGEEKGIWDELLWPFILSGLVEGKCAQWW